MEKIEKNQITAELLHKLCNKLNVKLPHLIEKIESIQSNIETLETHITELKKEEKCLN